MLILDKISLLERYIGRFHSGRRDEPVCRSVEETLTQVSGETLEIHLVPHKVCPGDCIYCPHGSTSRQTVERDHFYPLENIVSKVALHLRSDASIKRIQITGYGDPALNADILFLIGNLKKLTTVPVVVKSCGALLWRRSVCDDLMDADVVHINVDAADKNVYRMVNRYHLLIPFARYLDGISDFSQRFGGELVVNVHLLYGVNTDVVHLERLSSFLRWLEPSRIYVHASTGLLDAAESQVNGECLRTIVCGFGPVASIDAIDTSLHMQEGCGYVG